MKKLIYLILVVFLLFIDFNIVKATCNDNIKDEASKITIDKKIMGNLNEDYVYFQIQVNNITENLYVNITENEDKTSKDYYFNDTENGLLRIDVDYLYKKIKWTAGVYSNVFECKGELLKTLTIETPKYNEYYYTNECKKNPNPKYCTMFADTSNISKEEFLKAMKEFESQINGESENKFVLFLSKYYLYILIPVGIISIFYILKIIMLKIKTKKQI